MQRERAASTAGGPSAPAADVALLAVRGISKSFPGVRALADVDLDVVSGQVHALVGENGAGKSTLMKILAGAYQPDAGTLEWDGAPVTLVSPAAARALGISIIYQELNLLPDLTVAENVLLGQEPRGRFGALDWRALRSRSAELLEGVGAGIDPRAIVGDLPVARQQIVEIAKALSFSSRLIIMDEPTAALSPTEVGALLDTVRRLRDAGTAVLYVSHRLEEIERVSDVVTVLKDGEHVTTQPTPALSKDDIVRLMVGRTLSETFPARVPVAEGVLLEVEALRTEALAEVSFSVRAGEVVGLSGLEGSGQRELTRALFGLAAPSAGSIRLGGQPVRLGSPRQAIRAGVAFVSDDRKTEGLALGLSVRENIAVPNLGRFARGGLVDGRRERGMIARTVKALGVRTPSLDQRVELLSGGNQQKTVLAKWLVGEPRLLVFAEPTRGIDVGAKVELYELMRSLAADGAGVVMLSSDMLELLGMSDRILVFRAGRVAGELDGASATEEAVMRLATGVASGIADQQGPVAMTSPAPQVP